MSANASPSIVRFSVFELDREGGELRRRGRRLRLGENSLQLLTALVERPGEVVTREELRGRLWSESAVADFDANLNAAVKNLRAVLGDSAQSPRFVETLRGRGYRFLAPVEADGEPSAPPARGPLYLGLVFAAFVLMVTAGIAGIALRASRDAAPAKAEKLLLAVLPFENLDGTSERDYFADGLTEEMITQLGRLRPERLGVIARTSAMTYKATEKTIAQIGRELGVGFVLEGSVRGGGPGERLRITAQLVRVADQTHLWAESYDSPTDDVLGVQSEIAVRIARHLALELLPDQPAAHARAGTTSTAAYDEFLRGRAQWHRFDGKAYRQAIDRFERALELDPGFAHAYAGLADAYNLLAFSGLMAPEEAFRRSLTSSTEALKIDRDLATAHNARGFAQLHFEWDFAAAEASFERALELRPNFAMAYHYATALFSASGRHDEAVASCRKARELDPRSLSVRSDLGWYLIYARRYDEAVFECRRTLEQDPGYGWAVACLTVAYSKQGEHEKAYAAARKNMAFGGASEDVLAGFDDPDPEKALRRAREHLLADRLRAVEEGRGRAFSVASLYGFLGEADAAFEWLERAVAERDAWLVFLAVHPAFNVLRGDPRFVPLIERIGIPRRES